MDSSGSPVEVAPGWGHRGYVTPQKTAGITAGTQVRELMVRQEAKQHAEGPLLLSDNNAPARAHDRLTKTGAAFPKTGQLS